jgi:hypothetical protein
MCTVLLPPGNNPITVNKYINQSINYGIIIKSISALMYTVWDVDKYKITFKLVINWTNEFL